MQQMGNSGELSLRQKSLQLKQTTKKQYLVRTEKDQLLTYKIELGIQLRTKIHQKNVNRHF